MRHFLCLVLLLAACSKEGGGDTKSAKTSERPPKGDVATLFTGSSPTLPAEVASAKFGDKKADVLKAVGADSTYVSSKTLDGVSYDLDFSRNEEKLETIKVSGKDLVPVLTKQWGAPIKTAKDEPFWFAPDRGIRAYTPSYAKGNSVTFTPYEPLTKLLGAKGWDLAFAEGKPLLGATIDELHAAWGGALCDYDREGARIKEAFAKNKEDSLYRIEDARAQLRLCRPLPRTVETTVAMGDTLRFGLDGKVQAVVFSIPTGGSAELAKLIAEELDAKFGKPVELQRDKVAERWYFDPAGKNRAVAAFHEQSVGLTVSKYLPVAELLAGDKPGLSIETASMPVGEPAQIEKEDPEHFRRKGTLQSLIYPATDYSMWGTEIELNAYAKQKKTYEYSVVLHFEGNEPFGDEIMKLLETKFGAGKPNKRSKENDAYWDFAAKGRKVEARRTPGQIRVSVSK